MRDVCGVNRMKGESNASIFLSVYESFDISVRGEGMNCVVMVVVTYTIQSADNIIGLVSLFHM